MLHLFLPEGEAALAAAMAQTPLLAFDFDGTLAPIVARPDTARVPLPVARRLELLSARLPLGVAFEDKKFSITLHYRLARDRRRALARITELVEGLGPELRVFGGKLVVNFALSRAPDKAFAMTRLVDRSGARCATFVGDDVNDEPVFASARTNWLTVRVGDAPASLARFWLDNPGEIPVMLDRMLALIPRA